jgi:hypothetical protein
MPTPRQKQQGALLCAIMGITVMLAVAVTLDTAQAQTSPTPFMLPTPLPTILPDQVLGAALTMHGQAVTTLGTQPTGAAIIAIIILWVFVHFLISRIPRR